MENLYDARELSKLDFSAMGGNNNYYNIIAMNTPRYFKAPETPETADWGQNKTDVIVTDAGERCHAMYVAGCPLDSEAVYVNATHPNPKAKCVHTLRTGKDLGVQAMIDMIDEKTGHFPKVEVLDVLPQAVRTADVKSYGGPMIAKIYKEHLDIDLNTTDLEFIPHVGIPRRENPKVPFYQLRTSVMKVAE